MPLKSGEEENIALPDKNKSVVEKEDTVKAHEQADEDLKNDPDLAIKPEKGDDLDEGELAQLEGEE